MLQILGVFFGSRISKYIHERRSEAAVDPAELSDRKARILEFIRTNGKVPRTDVSELLDLGKSRTALLLEAMVKEGLILRTGEARGTHYLSAEKTPDNTQSQQVDAKRT